MTVVNYLLNCQDNAINFDVSQYIAMKNQYQFVINVGKKFEPTVKDLSDKIAGTTYVDLARWGIQLLDLTSGETPFLAYANRHGNRSIADVLSQLW
jgi:hypothetical protein